MAILTEEDRLGLLDGLTEASQRQMSESSVELFGSVEEVHQQGSLEWTTVLHGRESRVVRQHNASAGKYRQNKLTGRVS